MNMMTEECLGNKVEKNRDMTRNVMAGLDRSWKDLADEMIPNALNDVWKLYQTAGDQLTEEAEISALWAGVDKFNRLIIDVTRRYLGENIQFFYNRDTQFNKLKKEIDDCDEILETGTSRQKKTISNKCKNVIEKIDSIIEQIGKEAEALRQQTENRRARIEELKSFSRTVNKAKRFVVTDMIELAEKEFRRCSSSEETENLIAAAEQYVFTCRNYLCK